MGCRTARATGPRGAGPLPPAPRLGKGSRGHAAGRVSGADALPAVGRNLDDLQKGRQDPQDSSPALRAALRRGRPHHRQAGDHRQRPVRRPAHPRPGLPAFVGDHAGVGPRFVSRAGPHLDAVVRRPRLEVRVRRHRRVLRRPRPAHLRGRDRPVVRPGDELARLVAGPLPAGIQLRCALARKTGARSLRVRHRLRLLRHPRGAGDRPGLSGHGRILPRRG